LNRLSREVKSQLQKVTETLILFSIIDACGSCFPTSAGADNRDESICANALDELTSAYPPNSKQILLAEGHSDAAIIKEALGLLYSHLAEYYSIFDFNLSRSQSGTGQLVGTIKAFIAVGISNRVTSDSLTVMGCLRQSLRLCF
jgi:hypothetical protein